MDAARRLVGLGRSARTEAKAKVRQPLRKAMLLHPGVTLGADVAAEVATELNVKSLEQIDTLSGLMAWTVVPNFRVLGPRLGPKVNAIKQALADADGAALKAQLDAQGRVEIAGEQLSSDELEVRAQRHEAFALAEDAGWAVALDLDLDDELRREGLARELIRSLNDARKHAGLAIADRIRLDLVVTRRVADALEAHGTVVAAEVLATRLDWTIGDPTASGAATTIELDGELAGVTVTVA
jgi:isoleucyl-tRNA synthetase